MILEHILYNLSLAILVGIVYRTYTSRNPTWIIVICAGIPDIDYIFQTLCYGFYDLTLIISPIMIRHGDFHFIPMLIVISLVGGYLFHKICKERLSDCILCVGIAAFMHVLCDLCVYEVAFTPFAPFSGYIVNGFHILHETRNLYGFGEFSITLVGFIILSSVISFTFIIENKNLLGNVNTKLKQIQSICISIINDKTVDE